MIRHKRPHFTDIEPLSALVGYWSRNLIGRSVRGMTTEERAETERRMGIIHSFLRWFAKNERHVFKQKLEEAKAKKKRKPRAGR